MSDVTDLIPYADRDPFPVKLGDGVRMRKTDDGYVVERLKPDLTWEALDVSGGAVAWGNITGDIEDQDDIQSEFDEKGDVTGPASAVTGHLAVFADNTGKVIEDGGAPGSGGGAYCLGPFKIGAFDAQKLEASAVSMDGGTFTVTVGANTTAALAWNISGAALKTAIEGLASVGAGNVVSVTGADWTENFIVQFKPLIATELLTVDMTNLTGPDSPYSAFVTGATEWNTELFTPSVGDSILDFHHAIPDSFDSGVMAYSDYPDDPFSISSGWSSVADSSAEIKLDDDDSPGNFMGWSSATDPGYQRSARQIQMAYSTPGDSVSTTLPIVCLTAVPIYAAVKDLSDTPTGGEVWIWVDIVPATAP